MEDDGADAAGGEGCGAGEARGAAADDGDGGVGALGWRRIRHKLERATSKPETNLSNSTK